MTNDRTLLNLVFIFVSKSLFNAKQLNVFDKSLTNNKKMKTLLKSLFFGSLILLMIISCEKDKDTAEKFSTLSVEENKAIIEDTGIDLIGVLQRMRATETVDALGNLINITESGKAKGIKELRNTGLYSVIETYLECAKGTKRVNDVFDAMINSKNDDPESIQDFWDQNVGTYTWNEALTDWDIDLGGNSFIFMFPSSDLSNTNDATFTIHNYVGTFISNPLDDEYTGDLPVGVNADLKVGSETLVTFVFSASYDADGVPNAIAGDLDIEGFKFEVDVTNNSQLISAKYKFWENNDLIMSLSASANGLFTSDNIDNSTIHHSETNSYVCDYVLNPNTQQWEEVYCDYTDEWDEVEFEEILNSADAEFQILNISLKGEIDVKGLVDQIRIIEDDYDNEAIDEETYDTRTSEEINKYLDIRLVNLSNNEIMAKAEAYVVHESDYYDDYTYVSFRLTFGDGSPIDMETYFEDGFDDFVDSLNDLLEDISTDYDIEIDPIEY